MISNLPNWVTVVYEFLKTDGFAVLSAVLLAAGLAFKVYKHIDARRIKVRVSMKNGVLTYLNGEVSEAMLILQIYNIGEKSVIINMPDVRLKNGRIKNNLLIPFAYTYKPPHKLVGGDSFMAWCEIQPLAQCLRDNGLRGMVHLKGSFISQVEERYDASGTYALDIDDWTPNANT